MAHDDQTTNVMPAAVDADATIRMNPVHPGARPASGVSSTRLPSPQAAPPSVADNGKIRFGAAFRLVTRK